MPNLNQGLFIGKTFTTITNSKQSAAKFKGLIVIGRPCTLLDDLISASPAVRPQDIGEKEALVNALRQTNGNQSQAARILGINRVTVWNRMKKYGIDLKRVLTART